MTEKATKYRRREWLSLLTIIADYAFEAQAYTDTLP